ncbi:unnamed protein product [Polarella glacialis]|uniref:Uncharacterized protein n=1 Tax=Polarella glacialis TaxID=89957 RepID=A0A813LGS5_POLGL|nr:unnamed protein product [Polarella glacialis]
MQPFNVCSCPCQKGNLGTPSRTLVLISATFLFLCSAAGGGGGVGEQNLDVSNAWLNLPEIRLLQDTTFPPFIPEYFLDQLSSSELQEIRDLRSPVFTEEMQEKLDYQKLLGGLMTHITVRSLHGTSWPRVTDLLFSLHILPLPVDFVRSTALQLEGILVSLANSYYCSVMMVAPCEPLLELFRNGGVPPVQETREEDLYLYLGSPATYCAEALAVLEAAVANMTPFAVEPVYRGPVFAAPGDVTVSDPECDVRSWEAPKWSSETPQLIYDTEHGRLLQKFMSVEEILARLAAAGHFARTAVNFGAGFPAGHEGLCLDRKAARLRSSLEENLYRAVDPVNCLVLNGFPAVLFDDQSDSLTVLSETFADRSDVVIVNRSVRGHSVQEELQLALRKLALAGPRGKDEVSERRAREIDVLKIDIDSYDLEVLESVLQLWRPFVIYLELALRQIPPGFSVAPVFPADDDKGFSEDEGATNPLNDGFSAAQASLGAYLQVMKGRYSLLQIEGPAVDAVFVRQDVARLFPFARHGADEIFKRYVHCDFYYRHSPRYFTTLICDYGILRRETIPMVLRQKILERCLFLELEVLRGSTVPYTVRSRY